MRFLEFAGLVLLWLWQLPQLILGSIVILLFHNKIIESEEYKTTCMFWVEGCGFGVCLGPIIILDTKLHEDSVRHEYGHYRQSMMLGPLYLVVVGLPSLIMNIFARYGIIGPDEYYSRWPEKQADKLGGVKRR